MTAAATWLVDHWFATALIAAYAAMLVVHARSGLRGTHGTSDYFVGGRRFGGVAIGVSFYATFASTNSYLGHAGQGYEYGAPFSDHGGAAGGVWLDFLALRRAPVAPFRRGLGFRDGPRFPSPCDLPASGCAGRRRPSSFSRACFT